MNKVHKGQFFTTSNKVIWPKFFSNFMHRLKSAIFAIFQKSTDWLDWPCPVSAALHFCSPIFFSISISISYLFFRYETIFRRGALSFGHSDPDPSCVKRLVSISVRYV